MKKFLYIASKCSMVLILVLLLCGTLLVSNSWAPTGSPPPPPPPPPSECRVTGGGVDSFGNWDGTMAYGLIKKENGGVDRYTFGGQAGAPTASQPQPYGEWTHHQQGGPSGSFVFHAGTASAPAGTEIDLVTCSDPGGCTPSGDPPSPCKQIDFQGWGTFKNIRNAPAGSLLASVVLDTLYWFQVHIEDLGEPGKSGVQHPPSSQCSPIGSFGFSADCDCPDFYGITIYSAPGGDIIYQVYGYIKGGNLQIHYPIQ